MPDVKAALVRIVVAEVVSQLVSRSDEHLTPEDRNWITSVASRQRGRHAKKPTLILLFDLAFAVFDLAAFCRRRPEPSTEVCLTDPVEENNSSARQIEQAIRVIVTEECKATAQSVPEMTLPEDHSTSTSPTDSSAKRARSSRAAPSVDPVVRRVLDVVHQRDQDAPETLIDNVHKVINTIENFLAKAKAQRWHHYFVSKADAAKDGLLQAAQTFAQRLPLRNAKSIADPKERDVFFDWLLESLDGKNWAFWAELANECNYVVLSASIPEEQVRKDVCRYIIKALLDESSVSADDPTVEVLVESQLRYDETKLTVRRLFDMALCMEQFYTFFIETYGKDSAVGSCITWGVLYFEGLVQLLGRLRDVLILGSSREEAMISWSFRSLDIANYYREAVLVNPRMCEDIDRAIQSAFAEASWPQQTRAGRYMVQPAPSEGTDSDSAPAPRFWLSNLDLNDPVFLATAIAPWDPCRALRLLDESIGVSKDMMQRISEGKEGLPLWDYRRVALCRLLGYRGMFSHARLILERLQLLFDHKALHEGGNFSPATVPMLQAAVKEGNFCAQTTYGLLLAGQGAYWDVARSWAKCEKSVETGVQNLYLSAVAGDLEACTALSHIWAQCGMETKEAFDGIAIAQVHSLLRIAITSQNEKAVMNMGVLWRYGVDIVEASEVIAMDAFLMALQGGIFGEARSVAAKHLAEIIGEKKVGMSEILNKLTCSSRTDITSASSPHRIDDFCGTGP